MGRLQAAAQLQHRLGVDQAHPALGDGENLADLTEREVLEVLEGEHDLLSLGHGLDGRSELPS